MVIEQSDKDELWFRRYTKSGTVGASVSEKRPVANFLDILPNKPSLVYYKGVIYNTDTIDRIERDGNSNDICLYPANLIARYALIENLDGKPKLTFDDFKIIGDMIAANNPSIVRIGNKYINVNSVLAVQKTGKKTVRYLYLTHDGIKGIKAEDERTAEELFNLLNVYGSYINHKGIFYNSENIEGTEYRKTCEDMLLYTYTTDKPVHRLLREGYYSFDTKVTPHGYKQFIARLEAAKKGQGTFTPVKKMPKSKLTNT